MKRLDGVLLSHEEADTIVGMAETLKKIFTYLNSYANKDDLSAWNATSPHAVLGQVYGDLASQFAGMVKLADAINERPA
jgi:beta-lactamase superfamily II metal-dependent hydrolase